MLDCITYTHTPGGKMSVLRMGDNVSTSASYDVLGVMAQKEQGVFEVKWKGPVVQVGDVLLLPVKGSTQISLRMQVKKVEPLITPSDAWSAECLGPEVREFELKNMNACCDACSKEYQLEFIAFRADDQADAIAAMTMRGWNANADKQICPSCV